MESLLALIEPIRNQLNGWWLALGPQAAYYVWLASGVIGLLFWLWVSHRVIRRILGHRRYGGAWLNREQYHAAMQELQERERDGKILQYRDAFLLDQYRHGGHSSFRKHWYKSRSSI